MPPFQGSHSIRRFPSADALGSKMSPFGLRAPSFAGSWPSVFQLKRRVGDKISLCPQVLISILSES